MRANSRGNADIIYHMGFISLLCGSDVVIDITR